MNRYFMENFIEDELRDYEILDCKEAAILKQRMLISLIKEIIDGTFNEYGELLEYKLNRSLVSHLEELNSYELSIIESPIVVIRDNDKIVVYETQRVPSKSGYIYFNGPILSLYDGVISVTNYQRDEYFHKSVEKLGLKVLQEELFNLRMVTKNHINDKLPGILKDDIFKKEISEKYYNCSTLRNSDKISKLERFYFNRKVNHSKVGKDCFYNEFFRTSKDSILKTMSEQIIENLFKKEFKDINKALDFYSMDADKYLERITVAMKDIILNNCSIVIQHCYILESIRNDKELLDMFEIVMQYNDLIDKIRTEIRDAVPLKFNTLTLTDSNSSYKIDNVFNNILKPVNIGEKRFNLYEIVCYVGRNRYYILPACEDIYNIELSYRKKIMYTINEEDIKEISEKRKELKALGLNI